MSEWTAPRHTFFGVLTAEHTYKRMGYLLAAFPLGLISFIVVITGLALGMSLSILWIGLPILLGVGLLTTMLNTLERRLVTHLIGIDISPPPTPAPRTESPSGVLKQVAATLTDPHTWVGIAYHTLIKFPLGIVSFVLVISLPIVGLSLIAAPLLVTIPTTGFELSLLWFDSGLPILVEAIILSIVGVLLLPASLHLLNGFAWLQGHIAASVLSPSDAG